MRVFPARACLGPRLAGKYPDPRIDTPTEAELLELAGDEVFVGLAADLREHRPFDVEGFLALEP